MPATVILNPYSNRWQTGKRAPEIETCLRNANINAILKKTEHSGHGTLLARQAVEEGNTPLIAVGGDGTISEVINGLLQVSQSDDYPVGPVGFLPLGTANDLTDVLGIPRDLETAVKIIAEGHTRVIDVGRVNGHFFDNNSAIGLEPMVTLENIRLTWLKGVIRYMVSAIITILKRPSWEAQLTWDSGEYHGPITLVSVGNTHRTGGVFYMTPNASVDDGLLDFVYAPTLNRLRLFQLLPKTQSGAHIQEPEIHEHRTKHLNIHVKPPTPIQADGELITNEATEITYLIVPNALQVFVAAE